MAQRGRSSSTYPQGNEQAVTLVSKFKTVYYYYFCYFRTFADLDLESEGAKAAEHLALLFLLEREAPNLVLMDTTEQ